MVRTSPRFDPHRNPTGPAAMAAWGRDKLPPYDPSCVPLLSPLRLSPICLPRFKRCASVYVVSAVPMFSRKDSNREQKRPAFFYSLRVACPVCPKPYYRQPTKARPADCQGPTLRARPL